MQYHTSRRFLFTLPMAATIAAALSAMAWGPTSVCAEAASVAEKNGSDRVAISLETFSSCNQLERKALYRRLSQEQRKEMWRKHWTSFLGPKSRLTADQQATVGSAVAYLDRYFTPSAVDNRKALERDGLTSKKLKAQFGDSLATAVFAILGPDSRFTGHNLAEILLAESGQRKSGPFLSAALPPYCTCSRESDWCCQGTCEEYDCILAPSGCGTIFGFECNGLCGT